MACIAVYCSRELFPIPVTYVYIIYGVSTMEYEILMCMFIYSYNIIQVGLHVVI